jgi:hypothetical protein
MFRPFHNPGEILMKRLGALVFVLPLLAFAAEHGGAPAADKEAAKTTEAAAEHAGTAAEHAGTAAEASGSHEHAGEAAEHGGKPAEEKKL